MVNENAWSKKLATAYTTGITLGCLSLSTLHGTESLWVIGLFAFSIAIFSATQDIAIDGYRMTLSSYPKKKVFPQVRQWQPRVGGLALLALQHSLYLADLDGWQWNEVYQILAYIMVALTAFSFFLNEPAMDS